MSEKFRLDHKIGFQNAFYTKCINVIIESIGPSIILRSIFEYSWADRENSARGPDNDFFTLPQISQRVVSTFPEKQSDPKGPIASRGGGVRTCTSISKETYIHMLFQRGSEPLHPPLNPPVTRTETQEDLSLGFPIQYYSRHSAVG